MTDTLTIKEAAEACGVSQSTIRRSLERFDNAYRVPSATGKPGPWAIPPQDLVTSGFLSELPPELAAMVSAADASGSDTAEGDGAAKARPDSTKPAAAEPSAAPAATDRTPAPAKTATETKAAAPTKSPSESPARTSRDDASRRKAAPAAIADDPDEDASDPFAKPGDTKAPPSTKAPSIAEAPSGAKAPSADGAKQTGPRPIEIPEPEPRAGKSGKDRRTSRADRKQAAAADPSPSTGRTERPAVAPQADAAPAEAQRSTAPQESQQPAAAASSDTTASGPSATKTPSASAGTEAAGPAETGSERRRRTARAEQPSAAAVRRAASPSGDNFDVEAALAQILETSQSPGALTFGEMRDLIEQRHLAELDAQASSGELKRVQADLDRVTKERDLFRTDLEQERARADRAERDVAEHRAKSEVFSNQVDSLSARLEQLTGDMLRRLVDLESADFSAATGVDSDHVDALTDRVDQLTAYMLRRLDDIEADDGSEVSGEAAVEVDALTDRLDQLTSYMMKRLDSIETTAQQRPAPQFAPAPREEAPVRAPGGTPPGAVNMDRPDRGDRKPPGTVRQRFWQELKDGFRVPK